MTSVTDGRATLAVLDIDGVVADVRHRLHHLERKPKDWDAFFAAAARDSLLEEGAALTREFAGQHRIVWLTGRPERLRTMTREWLTDHQLPDGELLMRGNADRRPATVFKLGALRRIALEGSRAARRVAVFVDDDPKVIEAARRAGYPTLLADWVPRPEGLDQAQQQLGRT